MSKTLPNESSTRAGTIWYGQRPRHNFRMNLAPRFTITNAIAAALTEIEGARGFLEAASLSDEWIEPCGHEPSYSKPIALGKFEGTRTIEQATDPPAGT